MFLSFSPHFRFFVVSLHEIEENTAFHDKCMVYDD